MLNNTFGIRKKPLSVFLLVMINVIAIDSLRNLSSNAVYGLAIPFYYLLAALGFMLPCALVTAELATCYPKTGGVYIWVERAFGAPWGLVTIWLQWIYNVFWYPTILSFIAANIAYLFDPTLTNNALFMVSVVLILFFLSTLSNCFGMKISGRVSTICAIIGTLLPMLFIGILGIVWVWHHHPLAIQPSLAHFFPAPWKADNLAFFVIVLFSLFGLEMSAVHAEEVKNPSRDYPKALFWSCILIVFTVMLASTAVAMIVPPKSLNIITGLDQAFDLFLKAFHLEWLMPVALIAIVFGGFGGMSAWVIGPTKGLLAAADEGQTPAIWKKRNCHGAPVFILWMQAVLVSVIALIFVYLPSLSTAYWVLSNLTAELALLFYLFMFAAAIRLRYKHTDALFQNAYKIPGGNIGIWLSAGLGFLSCLIALILSFIPPKILPLPNIWIYETLLIAGTLGFTILPALYYLWQRRKKNNIILPDSNVIY